MATTTAQRREAPAWAQQLAETLPILLTIDEFAEATRRGRTSIRGDIRIGLIRAIRRTHSGSSRVLIPRTELAAYLAHMAGEI